MLTPLTIGFFLGVEHALDADHVVAVSTMIGQRGGLRRASLVGILWGLGHTTTLFAVGLAVILRSWRVRASRRLPLPGAYSWLKAPRYGNEPYEAGPLARMWITGNYRRGISVMDRHEARALEALQVARALRVWVDQLHVGGPVYNERFTIPASASSYGLTEAPRGALGHWITIAGGKLAAYQVITPTSWNASPRDAAGRPGPLEHALIGTPVQDVDQPIEVLQVIHSYDPCLACAVHVMRPAEGVRIFHLGHDHGEEEIDHQAVEADISGRPDRPLQSRR